MTPVDGAVSSGAGDPLTQVAAAILHAATTDDAVISAGSHGRSETGLHGFRSGSPYADAVASFQAAAADLRALPEAHRAGCYHPHVSQGGRLRRQGFA